ncbi:MAG TPA: DUF4870 domain-containing protein [Steroidobacteraceae bacterium]|jgi:uncharacterized Tic20 family protein|nr:DUF4870 domain-containing protein [Steroidobacteraceae bacterium]
MDGLNSTAATPGAAPTENERTWGMLAHLSALAGLVLPLAGIVIGPLVVWLARRDESEFVAGHAKEALNFNISVLLGALACMLLMLVFIGFLLGTALFIAWLVMTLIAAIKASEGHTYRYPFSLRLVK